MAQEPRLPLGRARGPHLDLPGELSLTLHTHSLTPTHSSLPSISTSGPLHMLCASTRSFLSLQVIQSLPKCYLGGAFPVHHEGSTTQSFSDRTSPWSPSHTGPLLPAGSWAPGL